MRLKNNVCIVTGAAQGIGAAVAARFAAEGAVAIGCDRRAEPTDGAARVFAVDVTDRAQVDGMVAAVRAKHGHAGLVTAATSTTPPASSASSASRKPGAASPAARACA